MNSAEKLAKAVVPGSQVSTADPAPPSPRLTRGVVQSIASDGSAVIQIDGNSVNIPADCVMPVPVNSTVEVLVVGNRNVVLGVVNSPWINVGSGGGAPAFSAGVANKGGAYPPLAFRIVGDRVELRGAVTLTSVATPWHLFTLPAGCWPTAGEMFGMCWHGATSVAGLIGVHATDGVVLLSSGTGTEIGDLFIAQFDWSVN